MERDSRDHLGPTLVIGYGNALRRDDGVGPHVAAVVRRWRLPGVATRAAFGLTPELAVCVAAARRVIFVDARLAADESERCEVRALDESDAPPTLGHALGPGALLALSGRVCERRPPALRVTVPAFDLSLGEGFSQPTRRELGAAIRAIARELARDAEEGRCTSSG